MDRVRRRFCAPPWAFCRRPAGVGRGPAAGVAVAEVIRSVAERGIKIVMSTHDLGEARRLAGDVVLLHRGRVVEHAPVAAFFSAPRTSEARAFLAGELLL